MHIRDTNLCSSVYPTPPPPPPLHYVTQEWPPQNYPMLAENTQLTYFSVIFYSTTIVLLCTVRLLFRLKFRAFIRSYLCFQSASFRKTARKVKRRMWWENLKMKIIIALVVFVILSVIIIIILFSTGVLPPSSSSSSHPASTTASPLGN